MMVKIMFIIALNEAFRQHRTTEYAKLLIDLTYE